MAYLGYVATLITFLSIYLYNKKHKFAPDVHIATCSLWLCYGVNLSLFEIVITNVVLLGLTIKSYKQYKRS